MTSLTAWTAWTVAGTSLVALMLLGYALFDVGSVAKKNTSGTIVRHVVVTFAATLAFLFIGFGLFFGGHGGFFGVLDFFTLGNYGPELPDGVPLSLFIASQAIVCAVCADIVCGALAERSNLAANVAVALVIGLLVYPFVNRWTWGSGWLAELGFHDFAGSASLNVVGGTVAFVAAALMGPREGKYVEGEVRALPGQSLTRCLEGSLLIFVGWFGLMGVSCLTFGVESMDVFGQALLGMLFASSASAVAVVAITKVRYGGVDVPMALNGLVGGLVAVSSAADILSPLFCAVVGVAAGVLVVLGTEWVERSPKVDDPVGTVVTHGFCGVFGLLVAGVFGEGGLIFGGVSFFGVELLGCVVIAAWTAALSLLVLFLVRRSFDLRVELNGIGVTGMTISEVRGCGEQKGARETYRGVPVSVEFVPKVQVDIVVSKVPVAEVVQAVRRALYTGHIGDGKVFVYGVAEAVKVRTGEHGYDAVQSIDVM